MSVGSQDLRRTLVVLKYKVNYRSARIPLTSAETTDPQLSALLVTCVEFDAKLSQCLYSSLVNIPFDNPRIRIVMGITNKIYNAITCCHLHSHSHIPPFQNIIEIRPQLLNYPANKQTNIHTKTKT